MIRRLSLRLVPLLLMGLLVGCASSVPPTVAQESTPPASMEAARDDWPRLTLETLFDSDTFTSASFSGGSWAEEGPIIRYTERNAETGATDLMSYDLQTGEETRLIDGARLYAPDVDRLIDIEDYQYSADRTKVLLYTDSERVWRLNTKGYYYVYDLDSGALTPISDRTRGFQMFAKLSPDGDHVAFVRDRNLFLVDLGAMNETQLTTDGAAGGIINGTSDWVYEEEFGLRDGFRWSPDGQHIAFFQLDESNTREFAMVDLRGVYPEYDRVRYPKAGEQNSEIRVGVIDVPSGQTRFFETGTWQAGGDSLEYIPQMGWTPQIDGSHRVYMFRMNRDQNDLDLLYGDPTTMEVRTVLEETSDTWLEVETGFSDLDVGMITYLDDEANFVWISERDGFRHLYLYENDGTLVRQLTSGEWDVTEFHGVDEQLGAVYFTATMAGPEQRQLYRTALEADGSNGATMPEQITEGAGWHDVNLSNDLLYYIDTYSTVTRPSVVTLHRANGTPLQVLESNDALIETLATYDLPAPEFMTIPGADGTPLEAYLIKPTDFDPNRAYPLLIHVYGGPGSQEVRDRWGGTERLWHHMLAEEHGILVAGIDNRGTGGRGRDFRAATYKKLGLLETEDQIAAAQHLGAQSYVDAERVGIWGWSYGGYMTLMSLLYGDGPETFKVGISGAPVTSWRLYDTIYTERFMSTPQRNEEGYATTAPLRYAGNLHEDQRLLLIHGALDDNVHFQNTLWMIEALQNEGKQFDLMVYPGSNHSAVRSPDTERHVFTLMTDYLLENL